MKILALSGFVPEHVCDIIRFTQYSGDRGTTHFCGYVSDYISQVLNDNSIDGAVFPKSCDSTRTIQSYLADSRKFIFQFVVPSYQTIGSEEFLAGQIKTYQSAVEKYYDCQITDIQERTEKINKRNRQIREIYDNISTYSYFDYLNCIHKLLSLPLSQQEWTGPAEKKTSLQKRVFLLGSFLSNLQIAKKIEDVGLTVVGDNLPESGRLLSTGSVELSGDIYHSIARSILASRPSPSQNAFQQIIDCDIEEIEQKQAMGVVFVTQKYCEPYDYLYAVYKNELDKRGIPCIRISLSNTEDSGKALLSLEAFASAL